MNKNNKENKRKLYIKYIICIVIVLFTLNRCTVACNRDIELDNVNQTLKSAQVTLNKQALIIDSLNRDIQEYQNRLSLYEDFRLDRQKTDSINNAIQKEQVKAIRDLKKKIK